MKSREGRSQIWLADHGEVPAKYSPQVHAALAVFFAADMCGQHVTIEDLAKASGVGKNTLLHYVKGVRHKMAQMLEDVPA